MTYPRPKVSQEIIDKAVELHSQGVSYDEVTSQLGVPHATIWRRLNPEKQKIIRDRRRASNIRVTVNGKKIWLRVKKKPKPDECELCKNGSGQLNWHHWNNDRPSWGLWLCNPCNQGVELIEKGLVEKYLSLKKEATL